MQCRSLGARIINLLNSPREGNENNASPEAASHEYSQETEQWKPEIHGLQPKRRIVIHTSPYLRCLQTAIAVSAGISQQDSSAHTRPLSSSASSANDAEIDPTPNDDRPSCLLRVDASLGEWLTPEYFEDIVSPPSSERMVMAAKAELLRRGDDIQAVAEPTSASATGYFPGGWGSTSTSSDALDKAALPSQTQTNRNRSATYNPTGSRPRPKKALAQINTNLPRLSEGGYVPPTPGYAISSSDPIPPGYVAHARDACMKIDYQWDSMRPPQSWGGGGEYGEEWSSMHRRFGHGLQNIVDWYQDRDHPLRSASNGQSLLGDDSDADETILVIVTHGAGCNALIGALTREPVLLNVGTASLTMAVRKDNPESPQPAGSPSSNKHKSPLQQYDLKLVASADHLRPVVSSHFSSMRSSREASPSLSSHRNRSSYRPSLSQSPFMIGPPSTSGRSTSHGTSSGLWGSRPASHDGGSESTDELMPNFGQSEPPAALDNSADDVPSDLPQLPQRTASQRGLWGSAPLDKDADASVRRRWTVTERRV